MGKTISGWILLTMCYFITFAGAVMLYQWFTGEPIDHNWNRSGLWMGSLLLTVPYLLAGLYARSVSANPINAALWISTVPMVCERILIYVIGALLVAGGGDGTMEGITVIQFIRGEAAPYYTVTYILLGLASPLLAIAAAGWRTNKTATA